MRTLGAMHDARVASGTAVASVPRSRKTSSGLCVQKRQPMDGEDSSRAAAIRPDMRTNVLLISGSFFCYSRKTGISAARKLLGAIRRNNSDAARFVTIPAAHFHRATVRASFCVRGASVAQSLSCPLAAARGAREHLKDGRAPPPGPLPHALFFL